MAKKGGQVQLQVEVNNDDDWAKLLEREGLIIVDVYSDWCGPCAAMSGNLKKIKLEIGGDFLHLAMAKSDNIKDLARFREHSEPTWMFIAGGKMVNLMFGANAPKLTQTIIDELKKEEQVRDGGRTRDEANITELSPEERNRFDAVERVRIEQEEIEEAAKLKAKNDRLMVITNCIANSPHCNFGMFVVFPYALDRLDQLSEVWDQFKQANSEKVSFKNINLDDMLFYTQYRFHPTVLELAMEKNCSVYLVKNDDPEINIDVDLPKLIYGNMMESPGSPDSLAERMRTVYQKPPDKDAPEDRPPPPEEELDGIWVPDSKKTRMLAMFMFFPNLVGGHVPPEPEPTPPHVACAFDAWKRNDVYGVMQEYPESVMHFGFFTDEKADSAKLIAKNMAAFEKKALLEASYGEKMVLQLSKKRSDAVLAFAQLGPTYMSINTVLGAKECKVFFPEGYSEEVGVDEDVAPTKKRSRKKIKKAVPVEGEEPEVVEEEEPEFVEGVAVGEEGADGEDVEDGDAERAEGESLLEGEEDIFVEGVEAGEAPPDVDKATSPMADEPPQPDGVAPPPPVEAPPPAEAAAPPVAEPEPAPAEPAPEPAPEAAPEAAPEPAPEPAPAEPAPAEPTPEE